MILNTHRVFVIAVQSWRYQNSWFQIIKQIYYKKNIAILFLYIDKYVNLNRWHWIESTELNPCIRVQMIVHTDTKTTRRISSRRENEYIRIGTWNCALLLYQGEKINSTWIKDLNPRPETVEFPGQTRRKSTWHWC